MADKIVLIMPDGLEDTLWMISAVMHYLEDRKLGNALFVPRPPEKVTLVCKWPDLHSFLRCCWKGMEVVSELNDKERDEADLVFTFDHDLLYKWSHKVEKHISIAAAFYLGAQPLTKFPPVAMIPGIEIPGLVLVVANRSFMEGHLDWKWRWQEFLKLGIEHKITMNVLYGQESWELIRREVSKASVVVGVRGTATLLGAAMGKVVMELTPDLFHRDWVSKWETVRYRMAYGKLMEFPADFILDRVGKQVKDLAKAGEIRWMSRRSKLVSTAGVSSMVG